MNAGLVYACNGVKRFHTVPTIQTQTVGQHVANMMGLLICTGYNYSGYLIHAIYTHDMPEVSIGDIPAPAKREMEDVKKMESEWYKANGVPELVLSTKDYWLLNLLDVLEGVFFCKSELKLGNQLITGCYNNYRRMLEGLMNHPEILMGFDRQVRENIDRMCDEAAS